MSECGIQSLIFASNGSSLSFFFLALGSTIGIALPVTTMNVARCMYKHFPSLSSVKCVSDVELESSYGVL